MKLLFHVLYGLALLLAPLTTASSPQFVPIRDAWRVGFLVQQPSMMAMDGRLAEAAAEVQTARSPADTYFAFSPAASQRRVTGAKFYLLARSGAYTGAVNLTLAVYDPAGRLKRVISQNTVDLQTVPASQWTDVALPDGFDRRQISAGEILAFHFATTGGQAGDLVVQAIFEASVESVASWYLPVISR